nr:MAK10-like protein [Tanacetum cinerariifolium]
MKILSVLLEITPDLAMRAIETPLSSPMGAMWCLCDPTPSGKEPPCVFQFFLRDQACNWLERLSAGSISTWEDLTTCFLGQLFPPKRTVKLNNDILMFQQHQSESLLKHELVLKTYSKKSLIMASIFGSKSKSFMTMLIPPQDEPSIKRLVAISFPQDVPSTSDRHLIELENQVQRLMEAHLAPKSSVHVNKIASSCEICSGPHDTQYCIENIEQAFVKYASSRTDKVGGKRYTFKLEQNNLGDTYNPS